MSEWSDSVSGHKVACVRPYILDKGSQFIGKAQPTLLIAGCPYETPAVDEDFYSKRKLIFQAWHNHLADKAMAYCAFNNTNQLRELLVESENLQGLVHSQIIVVQQKRKNKETPYWVNNFQDYLMLVRSLFFALHGGLKLHNNQKQQGRKIVSETDFWTDGKKLQGIEFEAYVADKIIRSSSRPGDVILSTYEQYGGVLCTADLGSRACLSIVSSPAITDELKAALQRMRKDGDMAERKKKRSSKLKGQGEMF